MLRRHLGLLTATTKDGFKFLVLLFRMWQQVQCSLVAALFLGLFSLVESFDVARQTETKSEALEALLASEVPDVGVDLLKMRLECCGTAQCLAAFVAAWPTGLVSAATPVVAFQFSLPIKGLVALLAF